MLVEEVVVDMVLIVLGLILHQQVVAVLVKLVIVITHKQLV
tara:strand:- start:26 stop:148 length:123 start_codon:yes stop_codon:yes gene_type:complete